MLFSEPYKKSVYIDNYENILIEASNFRIAAHLLYLKQLIYKYNAYKAYTC